MKEKDIQSFIGRKFKDMGAFIHKISDLSLGYKPFDFFGILHGIPFYIELKKVKVGENLPFRQIRENQKAALMKIEENASGFVVSGIAIGVIDDKEKIRKIAYIKSSDFKIKIEQGKNKILWEEIDSAPCLFDAISRKAYQ